MAIRFTHLAGVFFMTATATMTNAQTYNGLEIPSYTVTTQDGAFEMREYTGHIVAEVTVSGSRREAANRGFRVLANYIFGGNDEGQNISMTAPVVQTPIDQGDTWTVQFMMPSKFDLETLPKAQTNGIRFYETPKQTHVVYVFSGLASQKRLNDAAQKLGNYAAAENLDVNATPIYQFYDDPFTNPLKRRNEVAFVIN